jgi:hypothetical protein
MTIQKNILTGALAVASAVGLAACGGGDESGSQDVGTSTPTSSVVVAARAIDGYLAGATVYVDQNENAKLDAFEPRAYTDTDGYFSYNHISKTDYCAVGAPAAQANFCLRTSTAADADVLIRVTGGYDTVTGLPFEGTLSLRSRDLDSGDLRLVTPLTSMVADEGSPEAKFQALVNAGIFDDGTLNDDFIGGLDAANATRAQFATIAARLLGSAADVGTGGVYADLQSEVWADSYIAMAQKMASTPASSGLGDVFSSPQVSMDLLHELVHAQLQPVVAMPANFQLSNESSAAQVMQVLGNLAALNAQFAQKLETITASLEDMRAVLRVQALAAERAAQNATDPELADMYAWVNNQIAQGNGLGSDLTALGGENIDLSALIDPSFDFDPTSNSISASAVIPPEAAFALSALMNSSFRFRVSDGDKQGAALVFITGQSGATSGKLDVCVRYRDASGDFDTGSASDLNGAMLVNGSWGLLDNHTLMLNIEVAGGLRPLVLKSVGVSGSDREYRFDFGGDLSRWTGTSPQAIAAGTAPTNDETCKTALIDAFGSAL